MPSNKAVEWLLKVHIIIGNLKSVLNGIYHCVSSKYLQQYLYECCYRYPEIL
ncbi:MAG: transposase [Proteobacteria bacterium]|nr:transposase [Pseudomonadota bacterium]MBU4471629.1 transposase [Pseudomonadota bacterium]